MPETQSFENHIQRPLPAIGIFLIFAINFLWQAYRLVRDGFSGDRFMMLAVSIGLILLVFMARMAALRVQDRLIRHEMRTRLREVLPPALAARIPDFTLDQLVALRFAPDAELPGLCSRVLEEKIQDRTAIKKMIRNWQADHHRV